MTSASVPKRILVTGASGFLGRHLLAPLMQLGFDVHAVCRHPPLDAFNGLPSTPLDGVTWHQADLLNPACHARLMEAIAPSHLLHAAWYAEHGKFWHADENTAWLHASQQLFTTFAASGGQRIVGVGSCAEYDWSLKGPQRFRESDLCMPSTLYGQTKLATYAYLNALSDQGVSVAWGRVFMTFGPDEPSAKLIPSIIHALLKNQPALCTAGEKWRDFADVRDIAQAFALLANSEEQGVMNIASGESTTIANIATQLGRALGKSDLVGVGALPEREGDPEYLLADTQRFQDAFNWAFPSVETRLSEAIAWWKAHQS